MASIDVDERKLRSSNPPPTSSAGQDLKWLRGIAGIAGLFVIAIALIVYAVLG